MWNNKHCLNYGKLDSHYLHNKKACKINVFLRKRYKKTKLSTTYTHFVDIIM